MPSIYCLFTRSAISSDLSSSGWTSSDHQLVEDHTPNSLLRRRLTACGAPTGFHFRFPGRCAPSDLISDRRTPTHRWNVRRVYQPTVPYTTRTSKRSTVHLSLSLQVPSLRASSKFPLFRQPERLTGGLSGVRLPRTAPPRVQLPMRTKMNTKHQ